MQIYSLFLFFKLGVTPCKALHPLQSMDLKEKEKKRNQRWKGSNNCWLKVIEVIGQRKAFCRLRIPEPTCARKEAVVIDILLSPRNGDRKYSFLCCSMLSLLLNNLIYGGTFHVLKVLSCSQNIFGKMLHWCFSAWLAAFMTEQVLLSLEAYSTFFII